MQRKWAVGTGPFLGFAAAFGVILASALITVLNIRWIERNERAVIESHEVRNSLEELMLLLTRAEASQRAYLLTGLPAFRDEFRMTVADIETQQAEVHRLVERTGRLSGKFEDLGAAIQLRAQTLASGVQVRDESGYEGARSFVAIGKGREQMEAVRSILDQMRNIETQELKRGEAESQRSHWTAIVSTLLASLMGLAMVATAYYLTSREVRARGRINELLETKVDERTFELNQVNTALRASNRDLEQFASVASHDLQEPLRKIEAFGDRLKIHNREQLTDQGRDYLDRILSSASRMRTLINDLLNFSRVSTRAQPFTRVNLTHLVHEVVGDLEERITSGGGTVKVGQLPEIDADPTQIRQLFQNLIGNALKFQRPSVPVVVQIEGSEIVEVGGAGNGAAQVEHAHGREAGMCRITVADNGIGFEESYLDRIFQVFQRLHGRNEYEGTGIGLAICRKVVERHLGTITARSTPGVGSTFIITLPMRHNGKESV